MGLAQIQRLLAQLYTDATLRERFLRDRQAVADAFALSAEEVQQVSQLSAGQLTFFAHSLQRKRLNAVGKLLPLTKRALGGHFADLFAQHAVTFVPRGARRSRADAMGFADYVEEIAHRDGLEPPWVIELLRYEAARLTAVDPRSRCTIRWFRRPIGRLVRQVRQGERVPSSSRRPTIALWLRLSPRGRLWHVILP